MRLAEGLDRLIMRRSVSAPCGPPGPSLLLLTCIGGPAVIALIVLFVGASSGL